MTRDEKINTLARVLSASKQFTPQDMKRIEEKTNEQLDYIFSPLDQCIYLEACAGSGKTEVLGLKAAYEICKWGFDKSGIAVLTFTNEATATIANRVTAFYGRPLPSNHFIGTFSSFVHGHIAQRFGYKFYATDSDKPDKSFRVIDSDTKPYNNQWLENYKLEFPFPKTKIYASQLNYKMSCKEWFVGQGESSKRIIDLYNEKSCQQYIADIRKRKNAPYLFQFDYLEKQVKACKHKFWNDGFATFEDMNLIACICLCNKAIRGYVAKKFPVILVDECQDLSASELKILSLLIRAGSVVHYIGDLHQAIYSFKDAYPEQFKTHIEAFDFKMMRLSENFRSTQKIVDLSRKMGSINYPITGSVDSRCDGSDCCYLEYKNEEETIALFSNILSKFNIPVKNAVVLVRTKNTKRELSTGFSDDYKVHPIINAIQLWQQNEPEAQQRALSLLGLQLQKWLGFHGRSNNYYYSEEVCSNSILWRLLLRDILVDFCADSSTLEMDKLTYSAWYSANKNKIINIINRHLWAVGKTLPDITIKSPKGTAKQKIDIVSAKEESQLRIETIHAVKGVTYDAVLLLSTPNGHGKTGYWENWLNPADEAGRIGYVASTRPRYLLCWGVSELSSEQRERLEEMGFTKFAN